MKYEIWNMKYEIWNMKYEIWNMKYEIWNMKYEIWSIKYELWNVINEDKYYDSFLFRCGYGIKEHETFRRWMKKHKSYSELHREDNVGQLY